MLPSEEEKSTNGGGERREYFAHHSFLVCCTMLTKLSGPRHGLELDLDITILERVLLVRQDPLLAILPFPFPHSLSGARSPALSLAGAPPPISSVVLRSALIIFASSPPPPVLMTMAIKVVSPPPRRQQQAKYYKCARSCEPGSRCHPNECIFGSGKLRGVGILEWEVYEQGEGNGKISLRATWERGGRILSQQGVFQVRKGDKWGAKGNEEKGSKEARGLLCNSL